MTNPVPKPNRNMLLFNIPNIVITEGITESITRSVFISLKKILNLSLRPHMNREFILSLKLFVKRKFRNKFRKTTRERKINLS